MRSLRFIDFDAKSPGTLILLYAFLQRPGKPVFFNLKICSKLLQTNIVVDKNFCCLGSSEAFVRFPDFESYVIVQLSPELQGETVVKVSWFCFVRSTRMIVFSRSALVAFHPAAKLEALRGGNALLKL